jgi:hypothetical protein
MQTCQEQLLAPLQSTMQAAPVMQRFLSQLFTPSQEIRQSTPAPMQVVWHVPPPAGVQSISHGQPAVVHWGMQPSPVHVCAQQPPAQVAQSAVQVEQSYAQLAAVSPLSQTELPQNPVQSEPHDAGSSPLAGSQQPSPHVLVPAQSDAQLHGSSSDGSQQPSPQVPVVGAQSLAQLHGVSSDGSQQPSPQVPVVGAQSLAQLHGVSSDGSQQPSPQVPAIAGQSPPHAHGFSPPAAQQLPSPHAAVAQSAGQLQTSSPGSQVVSPHAPGQSTRQLPTSVAQQVPSPQVDAPQSCAQLHRVSPMSGAQVPSPQRGSGVASGSPAGASWLARPVNWHPDSTPTRSNSLQARMRASCPSPGGRSCDSRHNICHRPVLSRHRRWLDQAGPTVSCSRHP